MARKRKYHAKARPVGWSAPVRTKPSAYATKGFAYEVRLTQQLVWRHNPETPYVDLVDQLRRTLDCRVVGTSRLGRRRWRHSVRIFVRSEQDLFAIKMLTNDVFRVYALRSATPC